MKPEADAVRRSGACEKPGMPADPMCGGVYRTKTRYRLPDPTLLLRRKNKPQVLTPGLRRNGRQKRRHERAFWPIIVCHEDAHSLISFCEMAKVNLRKIL